MVAGLRWDSLSLCLLPLDVFMIWLENPEIIWGKSALKEAAKEVETFLQNEMVDLVPLNVWYVV